MFLLNLGRKQGFEDCSENGTFLPEWTIFCTLLHQKKAEHSKNGLKIAISL